MQSPIDPIYLLIHISKNYKVLFLHNCRNSAQASIHRLDRFRRNGMHSRFGILSVFWLAAALLSAPFCAAQKVVVSEIFTATD
jgi:hypothetical protein